MHLKAVCDSEEAVELDCGGDTMHFSKAAKAAVFCAAVKVI